MGLPYFELWYLELGHLAIYFYTDLATLPECDFAKTVQNSYLITLFFCSHQWQRVFSETILFVFHAWETVIKEWNVGE